MNINLRIILGYITIAIIAAWFVLNSFISQIKPSVRQSTEGALAETAHLLATIASEDMAQNQIHDGVLAQMMGVAQKQALNATDANVSKKQLNLRVYVTDAQGVVRFDSTGRAVGADYSRWNDVYLTLKGQYGARSTKELANDEQSSVMYVAAPIVRQGGIIGVLSVAHPNHVLTPVIQAAQNSMLWSAATLLGLWLMIGGGLSMWVSHSLQKLKNYSDKVAQGQIVALPKLGGSELQNLAHSIEHMRNQIEGKAYVEQYVHSLTHELKSPLTAIKSAAEILEDLPPPAIHHRFLQNIQMQTKRLQILIERLLELASLERTPELKTTTTDLMALLKTAQQQLLPILQEHNIHIQYTVKSNVTTTNIRADSLLFTQAIINLLTNAIEFSVQGAVIDIEIDQHNGSLIIIIKDAGAGIPTYALNRIYDRFYSLPRPNAQKSTGLGLSFVREVMNKHQWTIDITNQTQGGVCVRLQCKAGQ